MKEQLTSFQLRKGSTLMCLTKCCRRYVITMLVQAMRGERAFRIVSRLNEEQIALSVPNKAQITVFRMKQKVSEKLEIPVDSEFCPQ